MIKTISAKELSNLVASGKNIDLIDVRTPAEFRAMRVTIARNEPLDRLDPKAIQAARNGAANQPLYIICRSGARSRQACEKFFASGISNVINVEGGTVACAAAGVPVLQGKKAVPLNCQVQIITGLLVMAGTLLTLVEGSLYWLALPIEMGAGLVFSGLTNTCAMGTVLAYMPWNQVKANPSSAAAGSKAEPCTKPNSGCCN